MEKIKSRSTNFMFLLNEDKTILSDGMSNEGMELNVSVYIDFNSGKRAE